MRIDWTVFRVLLVSLSGSEGDEERGGGARSGQGARRCRLSCRCLLTEKSQVLRTSALAG